VARILTSFLLLLLLLNASALAGPTVRVRTEQQPDTKTSLEVTATAPESPAELDAAVQWARKELSDAATENAGLKPEIIVAAGEHENAALAESAAARVAKAGGELSRQVLPKESVELAKSRFKSWFQRHYRLTFTLVRGIANSTVVTWGLVISSSIPLEAALPVGIVCGGMSGGFQYYNDGYYRWIMSSAKSVSRYARMFAVQVGYMTVAKVVSLVSGASLDTHLSSDVSTVLSTAFLTTVAQGPWNFAVSESSRIAMERDPARAERYRFTRDLKTLAVSMISTAIGAAQLVGVHVADAAMIGFGAIGTVAYIRTVLKARQWRLEQAALAACENELVR
jgi:hypothetical protein